MFFAVRTSVTTKLVEQTVQVLNDGYLRRFRKFVGALEPVLSIDPKREASVLGGDNVVGVLASKAVHVSLVGIEVLLEGWLPRESVMFYIVTHDTRAFNGRIDRFPPILREYFSVLRETMDPPEASDVPKARRLDTGSHEIKRSSPCERHHDGTRLQGPVDLPPESNGGQTPIFAHEISARVDTSGPREVGIDLGAGRLLGAETVGGICYHSLEVITRRVFQHF